MTCPYSSIKSQPTPIELTVTGTTGLCVKECSGKADGDYQSCETCNGYVTCSNGELYKRPCPAKLVWDDVEKRCEATSTTCPYSSIKSQPAPIDLAITGTPGVCVYKCIGKADGDYQSCETCNGYVTCSNGELYRRPCPAKLVWDDVEKRCEATSTTCPYSSIKSQPAPIELAITGTHASCIYECSSKADGDYQSCETCNGYLTCSNGELYRRPCPAKLVWDDVEKRCEATSTTCPYATIKSQAAPIDLAITGTPGVCVYNCNSKADGDYQSCETCNGYVTCSNGELYRRPCPAKLVWDDVEKRCEATSKTCPYAWIKSQSAPFEFTITRTRGSCINKCSGMADGDYQSCETCNGYVTCSNGELYRRPCPAKLVWDDVKKRCEATSMTCPYSSIKSQPTPIELTVTGTTGLCVKECSGKADGDYQSCETCNGYVTCSNGELYKRPCPAKLVWDDVEKRCEATSTTCPYSSIKSQPAPIDLAITGTPGVCVYKCIGKADGDYQSCETCNGYVTCSNGELYRRPCPAKLVWDDVEKRCEATSTTCPYSSIKSQPAPIELAITGTHGSCIYECSSKADGDYQSCETCNGYLTCSNGELYRRPCPAKLVWDDMEKRCEATSTTCPYATITSQAAPIDLAITGTPGVCVYNCNSKADGDYQSCETCNGYVTCSNGELYRRPCPAKLVWDDLEKRCEATSKTCPYAWIKSQSAPFEFTITRTRGSCINKCSGMADGDYQSCETCNGYVTCSNGELYRRPCPAKLVWDDVKKRCEATSMTCPYSSIKSQPTPIELTVTGTTGLCVKECSGKADGDYQSCETCNGYVTCSNGELYKRPCPAKLVWDDVEKRCEATSTTCPYAWIKSQSAPIEFTITGTRGSCINKCSGMADGDYQSCETCNGYVTCSNGELYRRPCPAKLVWDDVKKRCESTSMTCPYSSIKSQPTPIERTVTGTTGLCVKECSGKADGDYQSCETCNGYVTCSNGELYKRPCPAKLVWDDVEKRCEATSTTCPYS